MTSVIHQRLEREQLLPSEHLMDTGYVDGEHLVTSQRMYGVEIIGPVAVNGSWQSKSPEGLDNTQFLIDWEKKSVTCPQGKTSKKWTVKQDKTVSDVIRAQCEQKRLPRLLGSFTMYSRSSQSTANCLSATGTS